MPYVNIKITDENISASNKSKLISGVTLLLADVLKKNPESTVVVIDEISLGNWGINGKSVRNLRE